MKPGNRSPMVVKRTANTNTRNSTLVFCLVLGLSSTSSAYAQQPEVAVPTVEPSPPPIRESVLQAREKLVGELAAAKTALEGATTEGRSVPEALSKKVDLLSRLDLLYGQILPALDHEAELQATKTRTTADLTNLRENGPTEPRPFSFRLLESLRDQLETESSREQSRADATEAAEAALAGTRAAFEQKERARRQAKEAFEKKKEDAKTAELATALQLAQLESRVAAVEVQLREIEFANQKLEVQVLNLHLTFLREKTERIAQDAHFSQEDLDEYLAQLDQAEFRLNRSLEWAQADFLVRDAEWIEVRRRLEASTNKDQALVAEFEARELARRLRQREVALIGEQLQALADNRKAWSRRFQVINENADDSTVRLWATECERVLAQVDRDLRIDSSRLVELRQESATLDSRIAAATETSPDAKRWLDRRKQHLESMIRTYEKTVDQLESARRLHKKLLDEISQQVATVTWAEKLDAFWSTVRSVWNYELTSLEDNPITVRKIALGIVLLLAGLFVSRRMVTWFGRRFLPRFGLDEGAIAAIQSLLFYILVLTVVMISLRIVNVPLTAFTILGGALAIGIGFGSQNIVNNFISGLILLAERPVRVGDLAQIDDLVGVIEHIGPRSTRVRSPENVDIIVPNSSFLEKNVINWTLTDDRHRAHISVGVNYGSPTREVVKLIRKSLDEHGKILPKPEPIVLFADFGDNALVFEAHFWVRMRRIMERRIIESDIRSRIDSLFREAGIVVAFPQRDVHLDARNPIPVQVLHGGKIGDSGKTNEPPPSEEEHAEGKQG